jgi:uncharacterized membrane protein (DUF485 family)
MSLTWVILIAVALIVVPGYIALETSISMDDVVARWKWIVAFGVFITAAWLTGLFLTWANENNAEESQAIANVLVIAAWGGALVSGVGVFMPRPSSDEDDGSDKISPQRFLVRTIGISVVVGAVALLLLGLLLGLGFWAASQGW